MRFGKSTFSTTRPLSIGIFIILMTASLCMAAPSSSITGGFTGPGPGLNTVKQVHTMPDDAPVSIQGQIVQHLGKDLYLFRDATGEITVEIDHDLWRGQAVNPQDTVIIHGEVEKEWLSLRVDADSIQKQ